MPICSACAAALATAYTHLPPLTMALRLRSAIIRAAAPCVAVAADAAHTWTSVILSDAEVGRVMEGGIAIEIDSGTETGNARGTACWTDGAPIDGTASTGETNWIDVSTVKIENGQGTSRGQSGCPRRPILDSRAAYPMRHPHRSLRDRQWLRDSQTDLLRAPFGSRRFLKVVAIQIDGNLHCLASRRPKISLLPSNALPRHQLRRSRHLDR